MDLILSNSADDIKIMLSLPTSSYRSWRPGSAAWRKQRAMKESTGDKYDMYCEPNVILSALYNGPRKPYLFLLSSLTFAVKSLEPVDV